MLTCYVWLRGSLPSFLPIALQLALDVQVTVGSLLPYGAQPSRWGHICGVKAAVVLDRNEGLVCFSFPFGLILCVGITLWVDTAFDLILDRNVVFSVSLLGWFQDLHGGLPNSGVKLGVASVPVRPVGLIFCHSTTVLHAEVTPLDQVCWSVPTSTRPEVVIITWPFILPDGLQASICDFSSRHVTAGVFPGGPR